MSKHYKIHPGIGIARVGKSKQGFFVLSDTPDGEPFELSNTGEEIAFTGYKDASHLMRRLGARFKVFEYEKDDATSQLTFVGEVTPDKATIKWSIKLGNRKAASHFMKTGVGSQGENIIIPATAFRNEGIEREKLAGEGSLAGIAGTNQPLKKIRGSIMQKTVLLGEAGTDSHGNLIVLGGHGDSGSWEDVLSEIGEYLNNDGWFDDIADGPVDAELVFADDHTEGVHDGAWVITGPPDFAPGIRPFVSLYDLIFDVFVQSGRLPHPSRVSFEHDIRPVLERAADHRWVNPLPVWGKLAAEIQGMQILADKSEGARPAREKVFELLIDGEGRLRFFRLTKTQKDDYFARWVAGNFDSDLGTPPPASNPAQDMDHATLKRCIGSGLFPGIEIGFLATNKTLYQEFGRFTRGQFTDFSGPATLKAGSASERMAVPWQADFMECLDVWWPSQRPDIALFKEDGSQAPPKFRWDRGVEVNGDPEDPQSHLNMVKHFAQLGVIDRITVNGNEVFAETGRDPNL
jgi:hypothetical protein